MGHKIQSKILYKPAGKTFVSIIGDGIVSHLFFSIKRKNYLSKN
jgi:hypothetical protein